MVQHLGRGMVVLAAALLWVGSLSAADQKKTNDEANKFKLADVTNTSTADDVGGEVPNATGALPMTAADEAEMRKHAREVKKVRLNKIGLARLNEERARKGLKPLVAGRDLDVAPVGEDVELSAPGGETPAATDGTEAAPAAEEPAALPSYVNNSTLKYFPPIGNQGSINSCAQWAGVYYNMTHEMALARNWDAKNGGDYYRFAPMFTYNFLNGGANVGSHSYSAFNIAAVHGVLRKSQFNTSDYKLWSTNSAYYRSALADRVAGYSTISSVNTASGLSNLKAHLANGHIAVYYTYINSWVYKNSSNDPSTTADDAFVGKSVAYNVSGTNGYHAMTVLGYSDDIWCDIDGDGVVDANEKGAVRIANSWGTGWGESGYRWVAYQGLVNGIFNPTYVWVLNTLPEVHVPKVVAKVTLNHNLRNQVSARVGIGSVGASTPATTVSPLIVSYQGGSYAFSGAAATSQDFTYYLDFTDIAPTLGTAKRWFVQGTDSGADNGNLTIKNFELYYTGAGVDQLVGIAANTPVVANGNTQYAWIDWTMGDVKPIVTWTTASQASVTESGTLTVTAQLSSAATQIVTVPFTVTGTATSGTDYTITASPITIAAGATTGTATITIKTDTVHELNNETVILTMGTPTNALLGGTIVHTATIKDDDNAAPVVNAGPDQTVVFYGGAPVPWTPADMTTMPTAWYDAADAATITGSAGAVSQWRDKSGKGLHLSQSTGTLQPATGSSINSLNAIDFTGDRMDTASNPFGATISNAFVIAVHKVDAVANGTFFSLGAGTNRWQSHAPWGDGKLYFDCGGAASPNRVSATYGVSAGSSALVSFYCSTAANVQQVYKNGTLLVGDSSGHAVATTGNITVGGIGTECQDTTLGEFIIINGTVDTATREKLEGYLAHKWGLTANLPAAHPYKSAAPMTVTGTTVNLAGSASDPDGDPLTTTWTVVSKPAGSTVVFGNASAPITTATVTAVGTYTLRLTATDTVAQAFDDVVITVQEAASNTPPVAFDDAVTTDQGVPVGVTLNASDADGDPLTYSIVAGPTHGTLAFGAVPDVLYTPDAGFSGTDSFTFKVNDGTIDSNTAAVTITVNHVNTPPVIESGPWVDTNPVVLPNTTLAHVLASDVDGDTLTYTWSQVTGPGTATFTPNGTTLSASSTVAFSAAGSYTLQVSVSDGAASTTGTVAVTVNAAPNQAPTANAGADQTATDTDGNGSQSVALNGSASSDADGAITSYVWKEGATQVATGATPSVTLAVGTHTITLTVTDDDGATGSDTATITVNAGNSSTPPVAGYSRWFDASKITGVANGGAVTTWQDLSGNNAHATVPSGNAAPVYVANAGTGSGLGALYFARNSGPSNSAALRFASDSGIRTVFAVFKGSSFLLTAASTYHFHRPGDTNAADPLWSGTYVSANIKNGKTYVNGTQVNGTTAPMPTNLHNGFNLVEVVTTGVVTADSFNKDRTYHAGNQYHAEVIIYDRALTEAERLAVEDYLNAKWFASAPVNVAPTANAGADQTLIDTDGNGTESVTLNGSGSSDSDGTIASYVWTEGATQIATGVTPVVTLAVGTHAITLTVTDDDGATATDTVVVTVNEAPNQAPVADGQSVSTSEGTAKAITIAGRDADGDPLTYAIVSQPVNGALSGTAPNLTYTPNAGFSGSDSFTFKVNDGQADSNVATVSITVEKSIVPVTVRYEAEKATISGAAVASNNAGYSGTGFVDYLHASGDYVEWSVAADTAGNAQLVFGYALSSGDRPLEIRVNGVVVSGSLSFPATGSWTNWRKTAALTVTLNAGTNTIRATAIGSSGANVDYLEVTH